MQPFWQTPAYAFIINDNNDWKQMNITHDYYVENALYGTACVFKNLNTSYRDPGKVSEMNTYNQNSIMEFSYNNINKRF